MHLCNTWVMGKWGVGKQNLFMVLREDVSTSRKWPEVPQGLPCLLCPQLSPPVLHGNGTQSLIGMWLGCHCPCGHTNVC